MKRAIQSRDRRARLVSMWLAGVRQQDIAAELGMLRTAVTRMAKTIGLPPRTPGRPLHLDSRPRNVWPHVVAWIKAGRTPEEIADGIGITGQARQIALGAIATDLQHSHAASPRISTLTLVAESATVLPVRR